jgi:hypothetical protein
MVTFRTKNHVLGKFWRALDGKILIYFRDILLSFGTFCVHLEHFSGLGIMYQEKSGNPDRNYAVGNLETKQTKFMNHCNALSL